MGVVHHSNYIRFLEEARCKWLKELWIPMEYLEENGYTIPTLEVNCKCQQGRFFLPIGTVLFDNQIKNVKNGELNLGEKNEY